MPELTTHSVDDLLGRIWHYDNKMHYAMIQLAEALPDHPEVKALQLAYRSDKKLGDNVRHFFLELAGRSTKVTKVPTSAPKRLPRLDDEDVPEHVEVDNSLLAQMKRVKIIPRRSTK